jgi:ABC-type multidrug transport system fused ATPase/permease subunit
MDARRRSVSSWGSNIPTGTGDDILRRLSRTLSGKSHEAQDEHDREEEEDEDDASERTRVDTWRLASAMKEVQLNDPAEGRSLGVTWKNLTVKVVPSEAVLQENALSQFNILQQAKESRHKAPLRTILDNSSGCVKPGEMLLVLGRPGSGCTTLLKLLANKRKGYVSIFPP